MRSKKNWMAGMLAASLVMSSFAGGTVSKAAFNPKGENAKLAQYQLYDVDRDGYKEMFIGYASGEKISVDVYGYDKSLGAITRLKTFNKVIAFKKNSKKKQIVVATSGSAKAETYTTYKISKNKLKKVVTYSKNKQVYKKNGKNVKASVYNNYVRGVKKLTDLKGKEYSAAEKKTLFSKKNWDLADGFGKKIENVLKYVPFNMKKDSSIDGSMPGPFYTLNKTSHKITEIYYGGKQYYVEGVKVGNTMKKASDKLKSDGWKFHEVTFAHGTASAVVSYKKDGKIIDIISDTEGDFDNVTEEANVKNGKVGSIFLRK
ncbi:MAG: hypothetical protein E7277_08290 [Lachnospiraceae bacterium]|jgi:hypothetical protein|nr:hypothetical protein [Lachnospiraceae bacterium]